MVNARLPGVPDSPGNGTEPNGGLEPGGPIQEGTTVGESGIGETNYLYWQGLTAVFPPASTTDAPIAGILCGLLDCQPPTPPPPPGYKECITAALEQVIAAGEGTTGPNGYGLLAYGTVTSAPQFPSLVGTTGTASHPIVIDPNTLTSFPNIAVQTRYGPSHAYGRYQFFPGTWAMFGDASNISPAAQDTAAANMLNFYDAVQPAMEGNLRQAFWNMFQWASMPNAPYGQGGLSMQQATNTFNNALRHLPQCR